MENQEKLLQFVEWLGQNVPELKGQSPEQIVETVNKLSASEEGQQMLQGLIQEFESSMTGMFKKGGKLDYLLCLKKGGNIQDCGCGKKISKKQPGGEIAAHPVQTSRDNAVKDFYDQRNVNGNTITEVSAYWNGQLDSPAGSYTQVIDSNGQTHYYQNEPRLGQMVSRKLRNRVGEKFYNQSKRLLLNQANAPAVIQQYGPVGNGVPMNQEGGRVLGSDQYRHVSRREAINAAMDSGMTRGQARRAYQNQKNAMSSNGFTGDEMKQHARWNMIDSVYPRATEPVQRPEPIPTVSSISMPNAIAAPDAGINTSRPASSTRPELLTFTNQNFDSAFGNARKMGLAEFGWNGNRYTTELKTGTPDAYETNPVDLSTPNPTVSGTTLPTSGWIAGPGYDPRVTQILKNEIANRRAKRQ